MLNYIVQFLSQQRTRLNRCEVPLAGLLLMVGVSTINPEAIATHGLKTQAANATPAQQISEGIHLYGQSSKPEQIGQEYLVFEVRRGRVIGALYMPHSEFSCFYGTLQSQKLDLMVVNPYPETVDSEPPEARPVQQVAAANTHSPLNHLDSIAYPFAVKLQEYQPISRVSENDQRILGVCKANYQQQVWSR